jgi:hypothetical protein
MPRPQRDAHLRTYIPPILPTPTPIFTTISLGLYNNVKFNMAASSIDTSSGDSSGKFDSSPDFPDTHIHLHYPSGNPHNDQAIHVDKGADTGGDL